MRRDATHQIRRRTFGGAVRSVGLVGERQVRVVASDATPDRMGDVLEPNGCDLRNYRKNPIVLAQHDAAEPIARCSSIGIEGAKVVATIEFPPEGVSAKSDLYLRLLKAGVICAVSVGFLPTQWEPIRNAGLRFIAWEMLELSVVSVPANPSAIVTERRFGRRSDDGDPAMLGNCGRPIGGECGLINEAECMIHGFGGVGAGTGEGDRAARAALLERALKLYAFKKKLTPAVLVADAAFRLGRF